ncbi:MAG: hypothetical protein ABI867_44295 [Kofleriaceae bacterium]
MRILWVLMLCGCGGGEGGSQTLVVDLSGDDQQALCEQFVDDICSDPDFSSFCTPCVTNEGCAAAVATSAISDQCDLGPITEAMVEECGSTGDQEVCLEGGGCMFDALEDACSSE